MTQEGNATFQEVFSMASLTDLIKLLPWFVSSTVIFCYMSKALATAFQQGKNVQCTTAAPKPEESPALGSSSSPAHPTGTPPSLIPLLPDIPFISNPPVGNPFPGFIASPTLKEWDFSISGSLSDHCDKRTLIGSPEVKVRSEHSSAWGDKNTSTLVPETGTSFN